MSIVHGRKRSFGGHIQVVSVGNKPSNTYTCPVRPVGKGLCYTCQSLMIYIIQVVSVGNTYTCPVLRKGLCYTCQSLLVGNEGGSAWQVNLLL